MKLIIGESTDVFFNLALEEYVQNEFVDGSYVLLWKDEPCVVVGKYQNKFEEINCRETEKRKIPAARRNSGGGTVFHDKGNLNYSFIKDYDPETFTGYDEFLDPIITALNRLGVPARKRNICDIAVGDKKVSGSAQAIRHKRILHHGTLLFDADIESLHSLLRPSEGAFESKAAKSVRSEVTNIRDHITDRNMSIGDFQNALLRSLFPDGAEDRKLTDEDKAKISDLAKNKYSTWEWIYGTFPKFTFHKEGCFMGRRTDVRLDVEGGVIKECFLRSEGLLPESVRNALLGQRYGYLSLSEYLKEIKGFEEFADFLF